MDLTGIRDAIEGATGTRPDEEPEPLGGGCINEAFRLGAFFIKVNAPSCATMFEVEFHGLEVIDQCGKIRVPRPITTGCTDTHAFLVLESLALTGRSRAAEEQLGQKLAAMHRSTQSLFGWDRDNYIGATPQPNRQCDSWIEFLREQRLGPMMRLAESKGYRLRGTDSLLHRLEEFFEEPEPAPSLLHGDLWGGNAAALPDESPVIFDPAVYFGDREADLAMTTLFGGFSPTFYAAYQEAWPLPPGHERRRDLYNLYHILNHAVLFGGGYARQAQDLIDRLRP